MHLTGLGFFYNSKEEIEQNSLYLTERLKNTHKIPGIRSFHCFIPNSNKGLQMNRISGTETKCDNLICISKTNKATNSSQVEEYSLGQFILCRYDEDWWVGSIRDISFENEDVLVAFMHPKSPCKNLYWPIRDDTCWVPVQHIIAPINPPMMSKTGRVYQLSPSERHLVDSNF